MIPSAKCLTERGSMQSDGVVTTGTASSQAFTLAFTAVKTRLYDPENYDLLGRFRSIFGVVSAVVALWYLAVIVLPRDQTDARSIVRLSLYMGIAIAALTTISLKFVGDWFLLNAASLRIIST